MKVTALIFSLFLFTTAFANDEKGLTIYQDGLIVEIVDFEEGDELKLFELETGYHVLSKTYSRVDLSQLPLGSYLLENNEGKSIVIDRLEEELAVDGAIIIEEEEILPQEDAAFEEAPENIEADAAQSVSVNSKDARENELAIQREGSLITVLDFEEGDKLKVFEVKDSIHVLSKTSNNIDLSQLPSGSYIIENNKGNSIIVEKFTEEQLSSTNS